MEHLEKTAGNPGNNGKDEVEIFVQRKAYTIHRGSQLISEIKRVSGVAQADVLQVQEEGKLIDLDDNGRFTIKGGENFFSHPRTSSSS